MLQDALAFDEYGAPIDLRSLPAKEHAAHMAILEGRSAERKKRHEEQQREAEKAKRQT